MEKAISRFEVPKATVALADSKRMIVAVVFCALYVALDWLTYVFPARFGVTPFNPESAVAIAVLMFCGIRFVPLVFLAVVIGEYALPATTRPPLLIVINSGVVTLGYVAVAQILSRYFRMRVEFENRQDVLQLMGVTLACMLVCGIIYVGVLIAFGIGPADRYYQGARRFFIGYSASTLVAAPLLFMLFSQKRRVQFADYLRSPEAWMQVATVAACIWWVYWQEQRDHVRYFYVQFLPLIWAATRFGMVGATSVLALIQTGMFLVLFFGGYKPLSVFELQLLLIALAITGLLLGVSVDEQRRSASELRETLKLAAAGEMAAAITHEINQPLTALSGYATAGLLIAASPSPDHGQLSDTMRKLIEESKRASAVVRRLRDFFTSGVTQLERIDLKARVSQVMDGLRAKADAANVTLALRAFGDAPVLADVLQIEVVLRNLLMNAIESAASGRSSGGCVTVEIETNAAGEVVLAVRDNGAGIGEADLHRVFDSFVTTKSTGMGMGLAISRAIVDAHGGRIWAVPGTSGLFCFALPLEPPSGAARLD